MKKERKLIYGEGRDLTSDDRSFVEQMNDLSVPIEQNKKSAKVITGWITARCGVERTIKALRLNKTTVSFSEKAAKLFEVKPGVYKFACRLVDYEGKTAILLKPDNKGVKLRNYGRCFRYMATYTGTMRELFKQHNVQLGDYVINEVTGGYLAVWEG